MYDPCPGKVSASRDPIGYWFPASNNCTAYTNASPLNLDGLYWHVSNTDYDEERIKVHAKEREIGSRSNAYD